MKINKSINASQLKRKLSFTFEVCGFDSFQKQIFSNKFKVQFFTIDYLCDSELTELIKLEKNYKKWVEHNR